MARRSCTAPLAALLVALSIAAVAAQVDIRSSSCPNLIQRGQTGQCVTSLQNLLKGKGFNPGVVDGDFGPNTETAVRSFQSSRGLTVDGIVGPNTKNALYAASPSPSGAATCTAAEFAAALSSNGYAAQADSKRVNMLNSISRLGGSAVISSKRELAMFIAQIFHESAGLRYTSEIGGASASYAPYYGRGYIQLTGRANYHTASRALFGDDRLVSNPDQVATNNAISWDVSTYYWKTRVHTLSGVSAGQFGRTTRGINGGECDGRYPTRVAARCNIYKKVFAALRIAGTPDCSGC